MLGRMICLVAGHHRSRGRARETDNVRTSVCERCGTAMRQLPDRSWVADGKARQLRRAQKSHAD